ncbi:hypothetical protein [Acinetobacter sp. MD2(2019)]|uniref:hypothetical protein n=1 Tax=Acinetobacter sp. MD2(2019) TaxID=2605273 RepID=UPI002D1EA054|nr:hypothetical protein [Acinetobacter sp. MD2(2019)]MEB3754231.1 hypothetical protein [Acinetobacter sp. MD2(2019)]
MKNLIRTLGVVLLGFGANYSHAEGIENFISKNNATASFNCAYKKVIASEKCIVNISTVRASTQRTKQYFGENGTHSLLKIKWPDHDVSQYAILDNYELWNLSDTKLYNFKLFPNQDAELDLRKGLIIESNFKEHIRLW